MLVKVGQEYAISAEELMAAFQRGGAAPVSYTHLAISVCNKLEEYFTVAEV